jgi:hypothetical protein
MKTKAWQAGMDRHFEQFGSIKCQACGKTVKARAENQRFCSRSCRNMAYYRRKAAQDGRRVWGELEYGAALARGVKF